jgi:hypothetical protein
VNPHVKPLLLIEANEVNFEYVARYVRSGHLPFFASLLARGKLLTTESETVYEHIEPWIQWVTVHTGRPFSEHGVFRLGDTVGSGLDQIWEVLERRGLTVGAVCPMNAENRLRAPAFFVPDPWTVTRVSGDATLKRLHRAIVQAVGANAEGRISPGSAAALLGGFTRHVPPSRWPSYAMLAARSIRRPWLRAIFLDELLADLFVSLLRRTRPHFASLFLNAAAHIQHHYLFNSAVYTGTQRNPDWYVPKGADPLLDVYASYDYALARIMSAFRDTRVLIATGLHQDPYPRESYYWRLKDHAGFLSAAAIRFSEINPLMSRDFVMRFSSSDQAAHAQKALEDARIAGDDCTVFECDNRGDSVFCTLSYDRSIPAGTRILLNGVELDFARATSFVAVKNGQHNGIGYLMDTDRRTQAGTIPLASVFELISEHFGASPAAP